MSMFEGWDRERQQGNWLSAERIARAQCRLEVQRGHYRDAQVWLTRAIRCARQARAFGMGPAKKVAHVNVVPLSRLKALLPEEAELVTDYDCGNVWGERASSKPKGPDNCRPHVQVIDPSEAVLEKLQRLSIPYVLTDRDDWSQGVTVVGRYTAGKCGH